MVSGMLWFDNDPKTGLSKKIHRAVQYYQEKYGQTPNLCTVHPKMVEKESIEDAELKVETSETILLHHLWIGIAREK
ncbi:MAG: hypothetical protein P8Y72_12965 [Anaerolineales bacterium]|jgi:hypothetical protein